MRITYNYVLYNFQGKSHEEDGREKTVFQNPWLKRLKRITQIITKNELLITISAYDSEYFSKRVIREKIYDIR